MVILDEDIEDVDDITEVPVIALDGTDEKTEEVPPTPGGPTPGGDRRTDELIEKQVREIVEEYDMHIDSFREFGFGPEVAEHLLRLRKEHYGLTGENLPLPAGFAREYKGYKERYRSPDRVVDSSTSDEEFLSETTVSDFDVTVRPDGTDSRWEFPSIPGVSHIGVPVVPFIPGMVAAPDDWADAYARDFGGPRDLFDLPEDAPAPGGGGGAPVPGPLIVDGAVGIPADHMVALLQRNRWASRPANQFPYRSGEYVFDDGDHGDLFEGFIRASEVADPLAPMQGRKYSIGRHIDVLRKQDRFHIVIHKGVPPKGLKILCLKVKEHVKIMGGAHVELFQKLGEKMKLLLGSNELRTVPPKHLAKMFLTGLKGKSSAHFVVFQTAPGGTLGKAKTYRARSIQKTLRKKRRRR